MPKGKCNLIHIFDRENFHREKTIKMPNCAVASCNWHFKKAKELGGPLSYFSFPTDPHVRQLWIDSCKRDAPFNIKSYRICSLHFSKDSYRRDFRHELLNLKPKRRLLPGAVPTLHLGEGKRKKRKSTEVIRRRKPGKARVPPVGVTDAVAENPWRKRSRLDSIGILRRSVRKNGDSNAKTNKDAIINESPKEDQQSKVVEDLNPDSTHNATSNKEIVVNLSATQNKRVLEKLGLMRKEENSTNTFLLVLQPKPKELNGRIKEANKIRLSRQNQSKPPEENHSLKQNEPIKHPKNYPMQLNKTKARDNVQPKLKELKRTIELKKKIRLSVPNQSEKQVIQENQTTKAPQLIRKELIEPPNKIHLNTQNPENRLMQTTKPRDDTRVVLQNKEQNTKQLCLVVGPNGESKISPYYLLRKETLEEVVERQREEIASLMMERDELRQKVVEQERRLACLTETSTAGKPVKAIVYRLSCKHKVEKDSNLINN